MVEATVYLSSLESTRFEPVRECRLVQTLMFDTGKQAALASIQPSVVGQDFNRAEDIDSVILAPRHEGATIDPITEFPCFVFIAIPRAGREALHDRISSDDLEVIAWGELYRTRHDAENHSFG
jgi:hypothetical protein